MASRESQVAARLRADGTLMGILLGKVWESEKLGTEGVTSATTTPAAYASGKLLPCCVVKQRGEVDDPRLYDEKEQVVGETLVVECWLYERVSSVAIQAAKDRIYTLLQSHRLPAAYPAMRVFTLPVMPSPEMLTVKVARVDYMVRSVRRAIVV